MAKRALARDQKLLNSFQLIAKLPDDILLGIFQWYFYSRPVACPLHVSCFSPFGLYLFVLENCGRSMPSLWSRINLLWPENIMNLVLTCSGEAPLTVHYISKDRFPPSETLKKKLFGKSAYRIRHLTIKVTERYWEWLAPFFSPDSEFSSLLDVRS